MLNIRTRTRASVAAASALTFALTAAACTSDESTEANDDSGATRDTSATVEFIDGWAGATDSEMSGVFGRIHNPSDHDLHLTGVAGEIDGSHELHEIVPDGGGMMMREKEDGFIIPGGGELILEPGGDHIMLMDLTEPITTGQEIVLTLEFGDGTEQDVTISARDFEGGEEDYVGGDHSDHEDDHGGMDHDA